MKEFEVLLNGYRDAINDSWEFNDEDQKGGDEALRARMDQVLTARQAVADAFQSHRERTLRLQNTTFEKWWQTDGRMTNDATRLIWGAAFVLMGFAVTVWWMN